MPARPLRPCSYPGCNQLVTSGRCEKHMRQDRQRIDKQRGTAAQRGYNSRWRRYREQYLREYPLCAECEKPTPATVVDHIIPHKGNKQLFWDPDNHQPLCKSCHDRKTALEDGGFGR